VMRCDCLKLPTACEVITRDLQHLVSAPRASLAETDLKARQGMVMVSKERASPSRPNTCQPCICTQESDFAPAWDVLG